MRLTIAYSKIKERNLVLINNATYQRETLSERPIRQPLMYFGNDISTCNIGIVTVLILCYSFYSTLERSVKVGYISLYNCKIQCRYGAKYANNNNLLSFYKKKTRIYIHYKAQIQVLRLELISVTQFYGSQLEKMKKEYSWHVPAIKFIGLKQLQISLPNFAFFTVKPPSVTKRSISQENAYKKG